MSLRLGDTAPDFEADTTEGRIHFHEWTDESWVVLFSHPKDFTPVCTTELGRVSQLKPEFDRRGVKLVGLSIDSVKDHLAWSKDIEETQGFAPAFPMIGDSDLRVSQLYDMLPAAATGEARNRTAVDNATVRSVFVIAPDKKVRLILTYPMSTGRSFDELLRVIDSLQLTAEQAVGTPAEWRPGDDVIILPSVSNDEAASRFPEGWNEVKPYLRVLPQPGI